MQPTMAAFDGIVVVALLTVAVQNLPYIERPIIDMRGPTADRLVPVEGAGKQPFRARRSKSGSSSIYRKTRGVENVVYSGLRRKERWLGG